MPLVLVVVKAPRTSIRRPAALTVDQFTLHSGPAPWPLATSANIMSVVFTVAAPE